MSTWTGKFDLCDEIMLTGAHYLTRKENEDDLDFEIRCLKLFKERIDDKLYQSFPLELNIFNIDKEIEYVNNPQILSKTEHRKIVKDRRTKTGEREVVYYTYTLYGKEFANLKDIPYYAHKVIPIKSILDLVRYYDYIMAVHSSSDEGDYVQLANESYNDERYVSYRRSGIETDYIEKNKQELIDHYNKLVMRVTYNTIKMMKDDAGNKLKDNAFKYVNGEITEEDYHFQSGYFEALAEVCKTLM